MKTVTLPSESHVQLLLLLLFAIAAPVAGQQPSQEPARAPSPRASDGGKWHFGNPDDTQKLPAPVSSPAPPISPPANVTTYTYDALGRLVQSDVSTDGATVTTKIQYDPAGNRTNYTVTGANRASDDTGDGAAVMRPTGVVVVPLNGLTIIPLDADT